MNETAEIKAKLRQRMADVASKLAPGGRRQGHKYLPLNPVRGDRHPGSFIIDVSGPTAGRWVEFAETGADGKALGGDEIALIGYLACNGVNDYRAAFNWARDFLGMTGRVPTARERDQRRIDAEKAAKDAAEAQDKARRKKASAAFNFWSEQCEPLKGTLGERYLMETRKLDLNLVPGDLGALRFHPSALYQDEAGNKAYYPAIVSAMSRWGERRPPAVHRIYLDPKHPVKANVAQPKKTWGDVQAAAIRVSKGPWKRSPEATFKATGEIIDNTLAEGLEDAIAAAIRWPEEAVWAAGMLVQLGTVGWPPCFDARRVFFDRDIRDLDGLTGAKLEAAVKYNKLQEDSRARVIAAQKDMAKGRHLSWVMPKASKDANDVLRKALEA